MYRPDSLRALVRSKLADGRLSHTSIPRISGGRGNGQACSACEQMITKWNYVMEAGGEGSGDFQFHVQCFQVWDSERGVRRRSSN